MKSKPVIYQNYEDFCHFLSKLLLSNGDKTFVVALDGRSGTGKSTIAKKIEVEFGCANITTDNFYVGGTNNYWDSLTPQKRMDTVIDWSRIRYEVLMPLLAGKQAKWQSFNWHAGYGLSPEFIISQPKKLIVLDGAYSSRPELQDLINLSVLVEVPFDDHRRQRLVGREGEEYMTDWHRRWDPAEDYYFLKVRPKDSFDIIITNDNDH